MSSIKRQAHQLKSEKSMAMPRHMLFVDTETTPVENPDGSVTQTLRLGWACYYRRAYGRHLEREEWFYFESASDFWVWLFSKTEPKIKLWIIARNVTFDFTIVKGWKYLAEAGYKLKFFHTSGTCNIISVRKPKSSIVFLDSMNWFVESLEKTGKRIGIPKLKIDFAKCSKSELSIYCRRDVKIELENFKLFIRFLTANNIARLCYTRGSTAMAAFLLRHYTTPIYIHNNKEAIDLERDSYRGGRTECFYIGELNGQYYYTVDVNSLYPYVMREGLYPVKYKQTTHRLTETTLGKNLKSHSVIGQVLIETTEPVYAVRRERTIFPVGRYWVTLCSSELKYALEHGHVKDVGTCVIYEQANIFESYVTKFYSLRQEFKSAGVAEYEELCKKMLNSLYGKFGQKAEQWEKIGDCPDEPDRIEDVFPAGKGRRYQLRYLLGEIFQLTGYEESFDSFPAIAAEVTAYARIYLWSLMQKAGDGNYFYCDTDSLIVNEAGLCNLNDLITPTGLGGLKIEGRSERVIIRGLKDYSTDSKNVTKGVRKNAVKISDGVYRQETWPSFKGLLRNSETETYTVRQTVKHLSREYTKGVVTPSGFIEPFVLDERPLPF